MIVHYYIQKLVPYIISVGKLYQYFIKLYVSNQIQSEKNSSDKELQKLYEQPIMVKTNGEFNGKFNYPLQIVDKQVEENEYLSKCVCFNVN